MHPTAGGVSEADYVELLLEQQVSGVVFAGGLYAQADAPHEHYRRLADRACRSCWSTPPIDDLGFPRVSCDDAVAVEQALGHLRSLGHERIGLVLGPADHMPSRRKLAAFRRVAGGRRATAEDAVEHALFSLEGGQAAAAPAPRAAASPGIICASDPLALGAIRAVRRAGLSVPGDVSVVGYDDSAFMNCTDPPLTTVRQPIEAMGRAAVDDARRPDRRGPPSGGELLRAGARRARLDRSRAARHRLTHTAQAVHRSRRPPFRPWIRAPGAARAARPRRSYAGGGLPPSPSAVPSPSAITAYENHDRAIPAARRATRSRPEALQDHDPVTTPASGATVIHLAGPTCPRSLNIRR